MTTGTYNFLSVIANVAFFGALVSATGGLAAALAAYVIKSVRTQLLDHAKI